MRTIFEAAYVIARRDFVATVYRPTFLLFLLAPVLLMGLSLLMGVYAAQSDQAATRDAVAIVAEAPAADAVLAARDRLAAGTNERVFPVMAAVPPEADVDAQVRQLLTDRETGYKAVLSGTLERPVLTGPPDEAVARRIELIVNEARQALALERSGGAPAPVALATVVTEDAAGSLRSFRHGIARAGQFIIFFVTLMLATLLLSNLVEEKSNKVIEVLAAAVPLDAVFLGKLAAMLAMSLVGLVFWGLILGLALVLSPIASSAAAASLPAGGPGVGWPLFFLLLLLYYTMNYMLLGALFLGIGGQAASVREVQTLSMPITFLQMGVLLLAISVIGDTGSMLAWVAIVFPLSSPLAMIALAAQSEALWPHLAALAWQALWVVVIIRLAAGMFRKTVLKSGGSTSLFRFGRRRRAAEPAAE